jgi:hypothetical protein
MYNKINVANSNLFKYRPIIYFNVFHCKLKYYTTKNLYFCMPFGNVYVVRTLYIQTNLSESIKNFLKDIIRYRNI